MNQKLAIPPTDQDPQAMLEALLKTYVEMNRMKSCETGEKSHALWHSTEFIKAQIKLVIKHQLGIL